MSIIKRLKIKSINFHSLCHTFATNRISLGIDYKTVSELFGHPDINITLIYMYTQFIPKKEMYEYYLENHC